MAETKLKPQGMDLTEDYTFSGAMTFDGTTLVVDDVNDKVGIGASPIDSAKAHIEYDFQVTNSDLDSNAGLLIENTNTTNGQAVIRLKSDTGESGQITATEALTLASSNIFITIADTVGVGIGTSLPDDNLHIKAANTSIKMEATDTNTSPNLKLFGRNDSADKAIALIDTSWNDTLITRIQFTSGADTGNKDDGEIVFLTAPDSGTGVLERMRIASDGTISATRADNTANSGDFFVKFINQDVTSDQVHVLLCRGGSGFDFIASFQDTSGVKALNVYSNGVIQQPLQPSFLVTAPVNTQNTTGNGDSHTVEWDTEVYDQGADFNTSTFTFTAPVTGRYLFSASVRLVGISGAHTAFNFQMITSNRTYTVSDHHTEFVLQNFTATAIADMDANDTVTVIINASGGSKTAEVDDSAITAYFSGSLIN